MSCRGYLLSLLIAGMLCPVAGCSGGGSSASPAEGLSVPGSIAVGPGSLAARARDASFAEGDRWHTGDGFDPGLPLAHAEDDGTSLVLTPDWAPGDTADDLALACYTYSLAGYSGDPVVNLDWAIEPPAGEFWLAVSNFTTETWEWYGPADPAIVSFGDVAGHFDGDGRIILVLVMTGTGTAILDAIGIGDPVVVEGPLAEFSVDHPVGSAPLNVSFDASASTAAGTITGYEWDWDGDGSYDEGALTATVSHEFTVDGEYAVGLRVTDDGGLTGTASRTIVVTEAAGWTGEAIPPGNLGFAIPIYDVDGNPAVVYPADYQIVYRRATDALGTAWGEPVVLDESNGEITQAISPALVNGRPAVAWVRDTLIGSGNEFELRYRRAMDATGTAWAPTQVLAEDVESNQEVSPCLITAGGRPAVVYRQGATNEEQTLFLRAADGDGSTWGAALQVGEDGAVPSNTCLVDGRPSLVQHSGGGYYYYTAVDATGSAFRDPALIEAGTGYDPYVDLAEINGHPALLVRPNSQNWFRLFQANDALGTSWGAGVDLTPAPFTGFVNTYNLDESYGYPALYFTTWQPYSLGYAYYLRATDVQATGWGIPQEIVSETYSGTFYPYYQPFPGVAGGLSAVCLSGPAKAATIMVSH